MSAVVVEPGGAARVPAPRKASGTFKKLQARLRGLTGKAIAKTRANAFGCSIKRVGE